MILSFISLLLMFSQDQITKICVPKAVADSMLPCRPDALSTGRNKRRLLALVLTESHLKCRILAAGGSVVECPPEKEQLITATGLYQLHILIFFLAVFHVVNSALIMVLGRAKIHRWKDWEKDTTSAEYAFTTGRLLEQASYYYLLSIPPMLRKYGFHLVLSGNRYYISDQRQHAIRAYRNALFVYRENGWSYISNHVHYNVGSHLSLATQNAFLNEFSHVVQSMGMKFEVYNLRLPVINMASLKFINLKYSRVEIDEVRFEWAECMLDYI
ncbi:hypothetical protein ZIOFF_044037 [Zingiber officinale]|uniref:Uncharacterized protein n=1 Tax=Zingiber officinale TaxID=94328 RepID=A0A8J5G5G3_ZINOF|nr:hypothetical protein ZIOFF_044037 [Zingiber officinale]